MAVTVRIELHTDAIKNLLQTDPGIKADLQARADAVKTEADSKIPNGDGEDHTASVWVGADRQRATIATATPRAKVMEAENHTLLSSLDAARSP